MDMQSYKKQLRETVVDLMIAFMGDDEDCGFSGNDVEECEALILDYLIALDGMKEPSDEEIMEHVKKLVLALNDLNEKTDYTLIETQEREAICEIIQNSAVECGLADPSDDITEEWRDW